MCKPSGPAARRALGLLAWLALITPAAADWTDLTIGELRIGTRDAELVLVVPTGWVALADDDGSGSLSDDEVGRHGRQLASLLARKIALQADGVTAELAVQPPTAPPARLELATDGRHSTLALHFSWPRPVGVVAVHYALFTPGVKGAVARLAVQRDGTTGTLDFTPDHPDGHFDGRTFGHRFAMGLGVLGRERGLEALGGLLLLAGLAYGAWSVLAGRRRRG